MRGEPVSRGSPWCIGDVARVVGGPHLRGRLVKIKKAHKGKLYVTVIWAGQIAYATLHARHLEEVSAIEALGALVQFLET